METRRWSKTSLTLESSPARAGFARAGGRVVSACWFLEPEEGALPAFGSVHVTRGGRGTVPAHPGPPLFEGTMRRGYQTAA